MQNLKLTIFICLWIINCDTFAQKRLTNREVYDFEIGAVIHTMYTNHAPPQYTKRSFLSKNYSKDNDTVFFQVLDSLYILSPPTKWELTIKKHTIFYNNLDSLPFPGENRLNKSYFFKISNIFDYDKCGIPRDIIVFSNHPDSAKVLQSEREWYTESYYKGFGAYYEHKVPQSDPLNPYSYFDLLYYKSTVTECGERIDNLAAIRNLPKTKNIIIYPNPVKDKIQIQQISKGQFEIYNYIGEKIVTGFFEKEIDLSGLEEGIYYLNFTDGSNKYFAKFIK